MKYLRLILLMPLMPRADGQLRDSATIQTHNSFLTGILKINLTIVQPTLNIKYHVKSNKSKNNL